MTRKRSGAKGEKQEAVARRGELSSSKPPAGYPGFLAEIKARIAGAQTRAALAVSRELLRVYWQTGRDIVLRQERDGWGAAVIERLAKDLQAAFPGVEGFSARNLWRMRAFYLAHRDAPAILPRSVAEIGSEDLPALVVNLPWGHHVLLVEKVKDPAARAWYAQAGLQYGWSRNVLVLQIESDLYRRQGRAITNFDRTLPAPQSDLAREVLKDPYNFDFLTLDAEAHERELERGLLAHVRDFLLELGAGFAFVGSQHHLEVGGEDFYLDLLFYHLRLRCYVVVDLKTEAFKPEHAGKMNFYLSAVDDLLRHPEDRPSIGIVLCKTRNRVVAEYALRDVRKPVGVSTFRLAKALPSDLRGSLPTIEDLEAELARARGEPHEEGDPTKTLRLPAKARPLDAVGIEVKPGQVKRGKSDP